MKPVVLFSLLPFACAIPSSWPLGPRSIARSTTSGGRDPFNSTCAGPYVDLLHSITPNATKNATAFHGRPTGHHHVQHRPKFSGWGNFSANGVNAGGWLSLEKGIQPGFFNDNNASAAVDEESFCAVLGAARCGQLLEDRYKTFFTKEDIDTFVSYGVNTLRVPVGYWAFMASEPGLHYHTGGQLAALTNLSRYATHKGMHIVLDLHGLPGGQNAFDNQGKLGDLYWWNNATNFNRTIQLVDLATDYILAQSRPDQFTLSLINEPMPSALYFGQTNESMAYLNKYYTAVLPRIRSKSKDMWVMLSDGFSGPQTWDTWWANETNIVYDTHIYFFTDGSYPAAAPYSACYLAKSYQVAKHPVFIGEWSIQASSFNTLDVKNRREFFEAQLSAYSTYLHGGAFWNGKHFGDEIVGSDNSTQASYWSWELLASQGVVPGANANLTTFC